MPNHQFEALEETTAELVFAAIARAREAHDRVTLRGQDLVVVVTPPGPEGAYWRVETPVGDLLSSGTMPDLQDAAILSNATVLPNQAHRDAAALNAEWEQRDADAQEAIAARAATVDVIIALIGNQVDAAFDAAAPSQAQAAVAQQVRRR